MSSHSNLPGSKSIPSKSVYQGTYAPDKMAAMHRDNPSTQQSPDKTMKQLRAIFNPPDCVCAAMSPAQAARNKKV